MDRPAHWSRSTHGEAGFTLIEMAIVLAIIGVLIAMAAPILGRIAENNRTELTQARLQRIDDAMVVFLRHTGRLPCPGAPDSDPLGVERQGCGTDDGDDGILPFRALGLPEADARDGQGNLFTYHVASAYTNAALTPSLVAPDGFCGIDGHVAGGDLDIVDKDGHEVTDQDIAFVVVSHGKNAYGRYGPPNTAVLGANAGGPLESENSDGDGRFVDSVVIASTGRNGPFDDVVLWATRDRLANDAIEYGCAP